MADFDACLMGEEIDTIPMTYTYVTTYLGDFRLTTGGAETDGQS